MRVALVHNPSSGDCEVDGDGLADLVRSFGHEVHSCGPKPDWGAVFARVPDLIAVAGGDGTVRRIARAISDLDVTLAVLPMGTANNVARALGIAGLSTPELVASWTHGTRRTFDVGATRGPWGADLFLESVGAGLLADTIFEIDHGDSAYVNELDSAEARVSAALDVFERVAARATPFHCALRLDGRALDGQFLLVEVLNFGAAGPNLRLSPGADPSDGTFDVVFVEASQREQLARFLAARRRGVDLAPALPVHHATRVELAGTGGTLHLDDKVWHARETGAPRFEALLRPAALKFLVP
jgi:diacylglycerol kinase family enzyme